MNGLEKSALAKQIRHATLIKGNFQLRSGRTSTEYFDKYQFESDPRLLKAITQHLARMIPAGTELLAGLELGGVPIVTALGLSTGLPIVFVRKAAKEYGTCRLAEGCRIDGRRLLLIEDVITSGGQVATSAKQLRDLGAIVEDAICVIDRNEGGAANLESISIRLHALFNKADL